MGYTERKKFFLKLKQIVSRVFAYNILSLFQIVYPKRVLIVLTYACNSRCAMCTIWKQKPQKEFSENSWRNILSDPIFQKIEEIDLTGGEVFLKKNFGIFISLCIQNMPNLQHISIVSNGFATKQIEKNMLLLLSMAEQKGITVSISISLDAIGKPHGVIRGVPYAFTQVKKTLLTLKRMQKKHTFYLSIGSILMKQTVKEAKKVQTWAAKNNIEQNFQLIGFHKTYVNNMESKKNLTFTAKENILLYQILQSLGKRKSWKDFESYYWKDMLHLYTYGFPRSTPCPFLYDAFAIDALGNVYNCLSEHAIGSVSDTLTVSDIYFSEKNKKFRKFIKKHCCPTCNSGCSVREAIIGDAKKFMWFLCTGNPWYGFFKKNNTPNT